MSRPTIRQHNQDVLDFLTERGFDQSYISDARRRGVTASCSQCEALVICGVATHETGCPHQTSECDDCGAPVPRRQRLCDSCYQQETWQDDDAYFISPEDL